MNKQLLKDSLLWGGLLWLFGYILGFIFYVFVPTSIIGWVIMPFGIAATLLVLWKLVKAETLRDFAIIGVVWTLLAVLLDYFLLVLVLHPADGYYKLDVYLYYSITLILPIVWGYLATRKK